MGQVTLTAQSTVNIAAIRSKILRGTARGVYSTGRSVMDEKSRPLFPIYTCALPPT